MDFLRERTAKTSFRALGLNTHWPQCNLTATKRRGTIRGMHYQAEPKTEIKLVRCAAGTIFDVVVDLRRNSPTFGKWEGFELSGENRRQLYVPGGFAHGFQCLADNCEVFYQMSEFFAPAFARGVRWDDQFFQISWPLEPTVIAAKDREFADFNPNQVPI